MARASDSARARLVGHALLGLDPLHLRARRPRLLVLAHARQFDTLGFRLLPGGHLGGQRLLRGLLLARRIDQLLFGLHPLASGAFQRLLGRGPVQRRLRGLVKRGQPRLGGLLAIHLLGELLSRSLQSRAFGLGALFGLEAFLKLGGSSAALRRLTRGELFAQFLGALQGIEKFAHVTSDSPGSAMIPKRAGAAA